MSKYKQQPAISIIKEIKPEIRIIGFDDCPFSFGQEETIVIGVVFRGGDYLDGLISTKIKVDGLDATEKLINCVNSSRHEGQARVLMLDGITFGGFNLVDIQKLSEKTSLPVIVIIRHRPNLPLIRKALEKFPDCKKRLEIIEKAGPVRKLKIENKSAKGALYYQASGIEKKTAEKLIKLTSTRSIVPEPLRAADLICSGLKAITYG